MTVGVGGSTTATELAALRSMRGDAPPIDVGERAQRIERAQALMRAAGIDALWLDVSTSLTYFTGLRLRRSERLHGAVLPARGELIYVCPAFEEAKLRTMLTLGDKVVVWEEHEDPTALVTDTLRSLGLARGTVGVDEATQFAAFDGLRRAGNSYDFVNAARITGACRAAKSERELALMQTAKNITLQAHKAVARVLHEGITTTEVQAFLVAAHRALGAEADPSFNIVLFGEATAYPHGVPYPQTLKRGDMVLIDVGAPIDGYTSDITRSYVFGDPSARQRQVWNLEKAAQAAGFAAARLGAPCEAVDAAARAVIEAGGFGPGYATPGLPHRTGHGIGLDVHEGPYLVKGDKTPLAPGMTFSNEPTICIYGEFGVRLEDHFYMTEQGPRWFTQPAHSVDDPFGYEA
ncbi:Xaa-Pro peptidase family protein [Reyranella sp. CPCC 100927]|uniref:M24 family metallopeptidase n=1 Tax=Reyranella sp. CPCC 100927 TaxID=2599616 RepID=UPI0011B7160E|nr:Xaa-Pro peptidase family protein [Reyranella sp. CPCC 100927]TWT10231.1 aminopeptidase P family protein [Reyranella sp. CPCC 100927]